MKKALLILGIILFSLTSMASSNHNADKLTFDDNNWNYNPRTGKLEIPLLSSFGIARAGERAGFTVNVYVEVNNLDGSLAGVGEGSSEIKIIGDSRTAKNFVRLAPVIADLPAADWNGGNENESIINGWIEVKTSKEKLIHKFFVEGMKIFNLSPYYRVPGDDWPIRAFITIRSKPRFFSLDRLNDGTQFYECTTDPTDLPLYCLSIGRSSS